MHGLTRQQAMALKIITKRLRDDAGVCPSYREIGRAMGLKSVASVSGLVDGLVERGYLRKLNGRRRALEVITPPASQPDPEASI